MFKNFRIAAAVIFAAIYAGAWFGLLPKAAELFHVQFGPSVMNLFCGFSVGALLTTAVIALLTLPAATAGCFARRLWSTMVLAVIACWLFVTSGLLGSYYWKLPSGPVIVVIAAFVYIIALIFNSVRRKRA